MRDTAKPLSNQTYIRPEGNKVQNLNIGVLNTENEIDIFEGLHYPVFRRKVKQLIDLDLDDYKSDQMTRRLRTIMVRSGCKNLTEFSRLLETNAVKLKEFSDYLTINVSEFFRDADRFTYLKDSVLPSLLEKKSRLSIWSAGCSNGAEIYSVAMILEELSPRNFHRLLASDIDDKILLKAREGKGYREQDIRNVPPALRKKYFEKTGDLYTISDTIKRRPIFKKHNLLNDPFEEGFDLILCRNVVIYFTTDAKDKLFQRFSRALRTDGILFVGATEIIQNASRMGLRSIRPSFYQRID